MEETKITPVYEIAPGMTREEVEALFFDTEALVEQPKPVYRLDAASHRYYYSFDKKGEPEFFDSVTTLIKKTTPTGFGLSKWMVDNFQSYEEMSAYVESRADYGTFMHSIIQDLLIAGRFDLDKLPEKLLDYMAANKLPQTFINHADEFRRDLMAFAAFMVEYKVKPLAIELVLTHPDGYAGAIDLVCSMEIEEKGPWGPPLKSGPNKGKPKEIKRPRRIKALVDFKSGRKGFFPDHEVQLKLYENLWEENFPKIEVERLYNWAPNNWRTAPSYKLKDQTNSKEALKVPHLVELAKVLRSTRNNNVIICEGVIDIQKGIEENLTQIELKELVKKKRDKKKR